MANSKNSEDQEMNEAELQIKLVARINEALPLLKGSITIERTLSFKLGHHDITIKRKTKQKEEVRGRYDLLVLVDDEPLLLAELKAPSVTIEQKDIEQGLSYARLMTPMVPLVLISNGKDSQLFRT